MSKSSPPPLKWEPSLVSGVIGLAMLVKNPLLALKHEKQQWQRYKAFRKLSALGVVDSFRGYTSQAIPPKYHELLGIYELAMQRKPQVILELGGGFSTLVLAHACRDLAKQGIEAHLYSVDHSDEWQRIVRGQMPESLQKYVTYHLATPELTEIDGVQASVYSSRPVETTNLVFVDGGLVPGNHFGADALLLERNAPADFAILVDGRKETTEFLRQKLRRQYQVGPGLAGTQTLFVPTRAAN